MNYLTHRVFRSGVTYLPDKGRYKSFNRERDDDSVHSPPAVFNTHDRVPTTRKSSGTIISVLISNLLSPRAKYPWPAERSMYEVKTSTLRKYFNGQKSSPSKDDLPIVSRGGHHRRSANHEYKGHRRGRSIADNSQADGSEGSRYCRVGSY